MEDLRKESVSTKYKRVLGTLAQICDDYGISREEYVERFPKTVEDIGEEWRISDVVQEINGLNQALIEKYCLQDWCETVLESFESSHQRGTMEMVMTTIQCDASNAYIRLTRAFDLLKKLNDDKQKIDALIFLEDYCSKHTFEDLINNYDIVFRSKHAEEAALARNSGLEIHEGIGERKRMKYGNYFNVSDRKRARERMQKIAEGCESSSVVQKQ